MSSLAQVLKNWDWDKLQEKRSRQSGYTPPPEDNTGNDEDDHSEKRRPFRPFGGGNGGGSRNGGDNGEGFRIPRFKIPGSRGIFLIAGIIILLWLASGIYIVNPDEEGVVLQFGKYNRSTGPGPHYALPVPIETVYKPKVTRIMRSEIGYRNVGQSTTFQQGRVRMMPHEASMLTGDENVVNVQFSVQYKIKDAVLYLFNVADPTDLVHSASEAAMREVIGNNLIDSAITDGKLKIQNDATVLLQQILDKYGAGIQVIAVQLPGRPIRRRKSWKPSRTWPAPAKTRAVSSTKQKPTATRFCPLPGGKASAIRNDAEAYAATRIQDAEGAASRFDAVRSQYEKAPQVTGERLYYETMESILGNVDEKILMDGQAAQRALPYLPLPTPGGSGTAEDETASAEKRG